MTLLNDANKIYLGTAAATAVYAGTTKVYPGAGFDPSSLPGLEVWLDATTSTLNDGDPVSSWPNYGSGTNPSMVGSPLPVFRTAMLNGLPVVRFSQNQGMLRGTGSMAQNFTLLYITRAWSGNVGRAMSATNPPAINFMVGFHTSGQDFLYDTGVYTTIFPFGSFPGPWKLYEADGVVTSGTYTSRFFNDGVLQGSPLSPGSTGGMHGSYGINGYGPTTEDETMDCDVAEFLIYNRQLADADRIKVESYLRAKWGLS